MPENQVFEPEEVVLAGKILAFLDEIGSEESRADAAHLRDVMNLLVRLRDVATSYTSIIRSHSVAGELRDVHTLTNAICRSDPYSIEAYMPTRAVVGRSYLVAKFNFFRLLVRICRHYMPENQRRQELIDELGYCVRESVTSIIAEDVLVSIASDDGQEMEMRRKAIHVLADLWEHRTIRSVKDFFPLLYLVWDAKARVTVSYGTLAGTTELLALMREGCDPEVIDYFTSDQISEEERQALIELVFNATYEELETMRRYMERNHMNVLGPDDVAQIFNVPLSQLHQTTATAEDMFFTFRERQVIAYQRKIKNLPGPKKTAEEYLMIYYLQQADIHPPEYNLNCDES
jgi:hypothetical protein